MQTLTEQYWNKYGSKIKDLCNGIMADEWEGFMQAHYVREKLEARKEEIGKWSEQDVQIFLYTTARDRCKKRLMWNMINPKTVSKPAPLNKIISFFKFKWIWAK